MEIKPFDGISPSIKIVQNLLNFHCKNIVIKKIVYYKQFEF